MNEAITFYPQEILHKSILSNKIYWVTDLSLTAEEKWWSRWIMECKTGSI